MAQHDLNELMAALRGTIARLSDSGAPSSDRALTRALAHLWSAYDELEMVTGDRAIASVS